MQLLSFLVAFGVSALFCAMLLPLLKRLKAGQEILQYVTEHSAKQGTPTMGGIMFITGIAAAIIVTSIVFALNGNFDKTFGR